MADPSAPPKPYDPTKSVGIRIPGQHIRGVIRWMIDQWFKFHPVEAERFCTTVATRRQMLKDAGGMAATIKRTNWVPEKCVPARLDEMMVRQFTDADSPDGPVDWLNDKLLCRIFFEEFEAGRLTKHVSYAPNGKR